MIYYTILYYARLQGRLQVLLALALLELGLVLRALCVYIYIYIYTHSMCIYIYIYTYVYVYTSYMYIYIYIMYICYSILYHITVDSDPCRAWPSPRPCASAPDKRMGEAPPSIMYYSVV